VLKRFQISPGVFVAAAAALVVGAGLLALDWWLRPVSEGGQALAHGDTVRALERYETAYQRFDRLPIAKSALPGVYELVVASDLSLLYAQQRFDDVIERAGAQEASGSAPFWAGCALFDKGLLEEKPEARVAWISQSHQEFRRALDLTPSDWDAKFNYELTGKLVSGLQKQPTTSRQDMMKLLREAPKTDKQSTRKVG
jgi:hypothetical protein